MLGWNLGWLAFTGKVRTLRNLITKIFITPNSTLTRAYVVAKIK